MMAQTLLDRSAIKYIKRELGTLDEKCCLPSKSGHVLTGLLLIFRQKLRYSIYG